MQKSKRLWSTFKPQENRIVLNNLMQIQSLKPC